MKKVCNYIYWAIIIILCLIESFYLDSIFDIEFIKDFIKEHLFPTKDKLDLFTGLFHCVVYGFVINALGKQIIAWCKKYKKNKDNKEEVAPK